MKLLSLIPCIMLILLNAANAEEIIKCIDSNGNTIFTTNPQDGMKCSTEESKKEPKSSKTYLIDVCNDFSSELDKVKDEMRDTEQRRSVLNKELSEVERDIYNHNWSYDLRLKLTEPINNKIRNLSYQYSALYAEQTRINEDIRSNKCDELRDNLSRILNYNYNSNSTGNSRYRK